MVKIGEYLINANKISYIRIIEKTTYNGRVTAKDVIIYFDNGNTLTFNPYDEITLNKILEAIENEQKTYSNGSIGRN